MPFKKLSEHLGLDSGEASLSQIVLPCVFFYPVMPSPHWKCVLAKRKKKKKVSAILWIDMIDQNWFIIQLILTPLSEIQPLTTTDLHCDLLMGA